MSLDRPFRPPYWAIVWGINDHSDEPDHNHNLSRHWEHPDHVSNTGPVQSSAIVVKSKRVFITTWQGFGHLHLINANNVILVLCSIVKNWDLFYFLSGSRDIEVQKRQELMSLGSQSIQVLSCNVLNLWHGHVVAWYEGLGYCLYVFFFFSFLRY